MIMDINNKLVSNLDTKKEEFALDTNVLLWTFYGNSIYSKQYQKHSYPQFIQHLLKKDTKLSTTQVMISELFSIIEKNEFEIYIAGMSEETCENAEIEKIRLKDYRLIKDERMRIKNILNVTYKQVVAAIKIYDISLESKHTTNFKNEFNSHRLDFFDYSLIQFCSEHDIGNIITDDSDFSTYDSQLNIYTANKKCLNFF